MCCLGCHGCPCGVLVCGGGSAAHHQGGFVSLGVASAAPRFDGPKGVEASALGRETRNTQDNNYYHLRAFEFNSTIGVNIKYLDNPFGIKYKLNGFELGGCHPFQIRRVYILFQKGWRDIDVALRQLFSISVHLYRSMPPLRSRHTAQATLCEMRD